MKRTPPAPPVRKRFQRRPDGDFALRVCHRKAVRKMSPRIPVKCGDCDNALEIWHGGGSLEIGGVHGSVANWSEILLPLLSPDTHD